MRGENHIIGSYSFGRQVARSVDVSNRDLLVEFCEGQSLLAANTFTPGGADEKVTFMEPGSTFLGPITEQGYNMLDLLLCDEGMLRKCLELVSVRRAALATDHYLVKVVFRFEAPEPRNRSYKKRDVAAFGDISAKNDFAAIFNDTMRGRANEADDCNGLWGDMKDAMRAASETLPGKIGPRTTLGYRIPHLNSSFRGVKPEPRTTTLKSASSTSRSRRLLGWTEVDG